jgi:hypothetical protein
MNNAIINTVSVQEWINNKLSLKAVEETLNSSGYESELVFAYLNEFKRQKNAKKQFTGFVLMGIGGFIGFIACVMALLNVIPDFQDFFLFGLTMVGIGIVLYGMYLALN